MPQACRATASMLLVASACVGCATSSSPPLAPGVSDAPRPAGTPAPSETGGSARWPRFAEASAWAPLTDRPYPCEGHAPPRYVASPRVGPEQGALYESLVAGATVPAGFTVTLWHRDRSTGEPGPVYAMEKAPDGAWRFSVMDRAGVLDPGTQASLCARCHAEAPADHLFGLPRQPEPALDPGAPPEPASGPRPPGESDQARTAPTPE